MCYYSLMLDQILDSYRVLLLDIDEKCSQTAEKLPQLPCKNKCFDCCKQLFPIGFVDAFLLSRAFQKLQRPARRELERKAEKMMRKLPEIDWSQYEVRNMDYDSYNE